MAEPKSLEQMEQEITCAICHEHYREPKILPCLHYYCIECLQQLAERVGPARALPRVPKAGHVPSQRRSRTAHTVLRPPNDRLLWSNEESAENERSLMRAMLWRESRGFLSPVYSIHLFEMRRAPQEDEDFRGARDYKHGAVANDRG